MNGEMGKLYQLSDYRTEVNGSGGTESNSSLTFVVEDRAATDIVKAAERDEVTPSELVSRAIGMAIADSELHSEGYEGPIYQRPKRALGIFGGWLTRVRIISHEQIKLRNPSDV